MLKPHHTSSTQFSPHPTVRRCPAPGRLPPSQSPSPRPAPSPEGRVITATTATATTDLRLWGEEWLDKDRAALSLGPEVVVPEAPGDSDGGQQPGPGGGQLLPAELLATFCPRRRPWGT